MTGVLLVFLDGVGIGVSDPDVNPFFRARLPTLTQLLGGVLPSDGNPRILHRLSARTGPQAGSEPCGGGASATGGPEATAFPLDALLGVEGIPQSGTGQATLLTGRNGARMFGRHFGPWVPVALRPVVEEESVLVRALRSGHSAAFANAYPAGWPGEGGGRRVAGPPLAARGAGLLTRDERHLRTGTAVSSEMVNDGWRRHLGVRDLPEVTVESAGETLGRLASGHRLTLYAHYATDTAGHRGGMRGAVEALERVDGFLAGVLRTLPEDHLLLAVSDHGNIEDVGAGHTRNPAMGILVGPEAEARSRPLQSLLDVTPCVLEWLAEG